MAKKWDSDTTSSGKLLLLFTILLFNNRAFSLNELSSSSCLNASKATVLRLLRQLEQAKIGILVREKKGRESIYRLERNAETNFSLNPEAIGQLALCRDFMLHLLPDNLRAETAATIASLHCKTNSASQVPAGSLTKGRIDYGPFRHIFATLEQAIKKKLICRAMYKAPQNSEPREHWIAPKRLLAYHETIYVECWLLENENSSQRKYDDSLLLALQRFKSCTLTEISSSALPDIHDDPNRFFGIVKDEPFRAKIRFASDVSEYISERIWSEGQKLEREVDGFLLLTLMINNATEGLAWVLGFGDKAIVLEPEWFAKIVRKNLRNALANYNR